MTTKPNFENPSFEWIVYKDENFSVTVKNWKTKSFPRYSGVYTEDNMIVINCWNVYVNVSDTHPLFNRPNCIHSAPMHGGVTYEEKFSQTPAFGIKYDWQKEHVYYKFGSDYAHAYDEYFEEYDGVDGVPFEIQRDAQELVEWMLDFVDGEWNE